MVVDPRSARLEAGSETEAGPPEVSPPNEGEGPGRGWMLAFQQGDRAAFDQIVIHYRAAVRRFVYRYVQDAERVEDLTQEAFLRVFRAQKRYRPTAGFKTWLYTIVTRLCLNELRARRRERRVIVSLHRSGGPAPIEEDYLDGVPDPGAETGEEIAARRELALAVDAAIAGLPPAQRAAVLLLRFEEFSYQEIAQVLGTSVMAVKSLIHRGREGLRERLARFLPAQERGQGK